jgi:hypothetical protein
MRTTKVYSYISLAIAAGILSAGSISCTGKQEKKRDTPIAEENIRQEIQEYTYPLPSAFEVTSMLNQIEASYIVGISNDPQRAENYFSEKDKAVNLGIYAADLAYATTYNQKTEVNTYFEACETLVRELDFTAAFSQDLPDQIETNLDDKNKLVGIVTNMFENAHAYLNSQGRTEVSYLVLTGTVVEGLYLTTHISENTFQNPKIIKAILFQKEPLMKLEKMMENYQDASLIRAAYQNIKQINAIYAMEEGSASMTEAQVIKLTEVLTGIRNELVN